MVLTDGPDNAAHWEHAWAASALGVPLVELGDLRLDGDRLRHGEHAVDAVYRRTNADVLDSDVGRLLGPAVRAGTVGVVNAFGCGVGDDKLTHAYVEDMVRFYLGEEPRLRSVETLDLARPDHLERALDTFAELVIKPRAGHGGHRRDDLPARRARRRRRPARTRARCAARVGSSAASWSSPRTRRSSTARSRPVMSICDRSSSCTARTTRACSRAA